MNKLYRIDFREPKTASELAAYIGIEATLFEKIISSNSRSEFYQLHRIPKRKVRSFTDAQSFLDMLRYRTVWEPNASIAEAHKAIARRFDIFAKLAGCDYPHDAAYGYVRQRGTKNNARVHCGAPLLMRADIHNFFSSITLTRLIEKFNDLGLHPEAGRALAKFVTIDDLLPLGLNASPMLANLVCVELDKKIQKLAERFKCNYTRYADDIAISGEFQLPSRKELEDIIDSEGFKLANEKFRITKRGQAHYVTGLSVSDSVPHVPRRMKKKLRQELHYADEYGVHNHLARVGGDRTLQSGINRLEGTVRYISHIEDNISYELKAKWMNILEQSGAAASYVSLSSSPIHDISCYIDESEIIFADKKLLALGVVFTENDSEVSRTTITTLRSHQVDPFAAGDKESLKKNGLHFTDSHPDLRTAYIRQLSALPYRAFIAFCSLQDVTKYKEDYIALLGKILPQRFMWYDRANLRIIFEENSQIKATAVQNAVTEIYQELEKRDSRRPIKKPEVVIGKKSEYPSFAVPDYLLAVFGRYAQYSEYKKEESRIHQFERLRDKYRLIVDCDTNTEYSRRNPFQPFA